MAGLQLTSLGSLGADDWPRLIAAGIGLAASLIGIGYMILRASQLLTDEWVTLAQLEVERFEKRLRDSSRDQQRRAALERLNERFTVYQDELYGHVADSLSDLYSRLLEANAASRTNPESELAQQSAPLREAAGTVVEYANYYLAQESFNALRRQLAYAAAVVAAGVLTFAYAANPPKPAAVTPVRPTQTSTPSPSPSPAPTATSPKPGQAH
ncbi:hypothetical protein ABZW18_32770 [Streptomyces sp. NPDC004647]|uniref:hypothetical protein n=1 Tax=Streptomyces sp. NPDC004647 TaxID=3154671 RepID=UPI0033BDDF76